jgi:hypothetical protein
VLFLDIEEQIEIPRDAAKGSQKQSDLTSMMGRVNGCVMHQVPETNAAPRADANGKLDRAG